MPSRTGLPVAGLKENVIVGRLIPAGTGSMLSDLQQVAAHRDELILKERAKAAAKRIAEQGVDEPSLMPEAAEIKERVCRDALVMPSRTGLPVAGLAPLFFVTRSLCASKSF